MIGAARSRNYARSLARFSHGDHRLEVPAGFGEGASDGPALQSGGSIVAEWRENLAIMAANRTRDDERVMQRLGDRLWDERQEVCWGSCEGLPQRVKFKR